MMATTQASPAETGHQMDVYHINWVATDKDGKVVAEVPLKYGTDEKPAQHGGTNTKSWFAHVHEFAKEPIAAALIAKDIIHHVSITYKDCTFVKKEWGPLKKQVLHIFVMASKKMRGL